MMPFHFTNYLVTKPIKVMTTDSLDFRQRQIESYEVMARNMASIIGSYKGYSSVLVETLEHLSKVDDVEYLKDNIEHIANRLHKLIEENEELWNTRMTKKD